MEYGNVFLPEITGLPIKRNPMVDTKRVSTQAEPLSIESQDTHNPYMRIPETERKRAPGQRTDLRKLSAWIKMMRALEEAKQNQGDED
jgi:hypothetical protein